MLRVSGFLSIQLVCAIFCVGAHASPPRSEVCNTLLAIGAPDPESLSPDAHSYFLKRGISRISFKAVGEPFEGKNFASLPRAKVPKALRPVVRQVNETLRGMAKAFGSDFHTMFKTSPMSLRLEVGLLGPLGSDDGTMGIFSDWTPEDGVETAILAHEWTHRICDNPSKYGVPEAVHDLCGFFVFDEFFADWIAYKATGSFEAKVKDIDLGSFHLRGKDLLSYDLHAGHFSGSRSSADFMNWISELRAKKSRTAREERLLNSINEASIEEDSPSEESVQDTRALEELQNIRVLDPHQLGMPIFYFFRDLERRLGRDLSLDFRRALERLTALETTDRTYMVHAEGYPAPEDQVRVVLKTPRHFFDLFQSQLVDAEKGQFAALFKERNIAKGIRLEEKFILRPGAERRAKELIRERFRANGGKGQGSYTPSSPYYDERSGMKYNLPLVVIPK